MRDNTEYIPEYLLNELSDVRSRLGRAAIALQAAEREYLEAITARVVLAERMEQFSPRA